MWLCDNGLHSESSYRMPTTWGRDPGLGAGETQVQKVTFLGVWQVSGKQQREHMKILTRSQRPERGPRECGGEQPQLTGGSGFPGAGPKGDQV